LYSTNSKGEGVIFNLFISSNSTNSIGWVRNAF
jgi:hypothetical protein